MKRGILALGAAAVVALTLTVVAFSANAHFINNQPNSGDPSCTYSGGNTIECSFKIAGLGNVSEVTANVEVTRTCTTKSGSNDPPGQARSQPQTLMVENGQTTQSPVTFTFRRLQCPGQQTTSLGGTVAFYIDGVFIGNATLINV